MYAILLYAKSVHPSRFQLNPIENEVLPSARHWHCCSCSPVPLRPPAFFVPHVASNATVKQCFLASHRKECTSKLHSQPGTGVMVAAAFAACCCWRNAAPDVAARLHTCTSLATPWRGPRGSEVHWYRPIVYNDCLKKKVKGQQHAKTNKKKGKSYSMETSERKTKTQKPNTRGRCVAYRA